MVEYVSARVCGVYRFNEIEALLVVVEGDGGPVDSLCSVLSLLQLEDVLVEELLELLVGKVDTHLLEAVHL
jgi:hypothetical protein